MDPSEFLDSLTYAYFETDLSGTITCANRTFSQGLGYDPGNLTGRHYRDVMEAGQARKVFDQALQTRQVQANQVLLLRRRDGSPYYAEGSLALIYDPAGEPAGFRCILHDATAHQQEAITLQLAVQAAEKELEIGRRIQASFLPGKLPQLEGWEIASFFHAAREVSGDFYDAFDLSGGKRVGLVIADVCDKGIGSALFMALFRSLIRAFAGQNFSLGWMDVLNGEALTSRSQGSVGRRRALLSTGTTPLKKAIDLTNQYITENHGDTHMFATVFFGVLDPTNGSLMYINGGHEPPLVIGKGGIKAQLEPTGPAVGLFPGLEFNIGQITLEPGDILLTYTDGVIDAHSPEGERFSEARLESLACQAAPTAGGLLDQINAELQKHIAGTDQYDDITLLAVRRSQE